MRHNPSTVVVLAGPGQWQQHSGGLLAAVSRFMNVVLVRPADDDSGEVEAAAAALRRAAGISSPYVLVAADPLAAVAAEWQAMWTLARDAAGPASATGGDAFEIRAGEALASWRAGRFELPDYYLVLAREQQPQDQPAPDFYLGPLHALRPHRVAVVAASVPAEQAAAAQSALGSLRQGRWWPPLDQVIDAARRFYPGSLAATPDGPPVPLLG